MCETALAEIYGLSVRYGLPAFFTMVFDDAANQFTLSHTEYNAVNGILFAMIFGKIHAWHVVYETQGRGTLHAHVHVWSGLSRPQHSHSFTCHKPQTTRLVATYSRATCRFSFPQRPSTYETSALLDRPTSTKSTVACQYK